MCHKIKWDTNFLLAQDGRFAVHTHCGSALKHGESGVHVCVGGGGRRWGGGGGGVGVRRGWGLLMQKGERVGLWGKIGGGLAGASMREGGRKGLGGEGRLAGRLGGGGGRGGGVGKSADIFPGRWWQRWGVPVVTGGWQGARQAAAVHTHTAESGLEKGEG